MRKTFFIPMMFLAGAGWLPVSADETPQILNTKNFSIFPGKYTKDGKSFLSTYVEEDDMINRFNIYDEDMQLIKVIEPLKLPALESKYYVQDRRDGYEYIEPLDQEYVEYVVLEIDGSTTGLSIERVRNYVNDQSGFGEIANLPDGTQVVALSFFYQSSYGSKYPVIYFKEIDGEWHRCMQEYEGYNWGPFGEWGEVWEQTKKYQPKIEEIGIVPDSGGDSEWYYLTKGIFGDDYHYIMPIYEAKDFEKQEEYYAKPGWVYQKTWGMRYDITGFTVYDSSNNKVTSFRLPEGYIGGDYVNFFTLGDNRYIGLEDVEDSEGESYLIIYRLDSDNKVSFVRAAPSTKVAPRNPKRGEKVSVILETPVGNGGATVQVVSASGRTMLSTKLPAGKNQLDINTSDFPQGMYVVAVSGDGVTKEAAKIIVR